MPKNKLASTWYDGAQKQARGEDIRLLQYKPLNHPTWIKTPHTVRGNGLIWTKYQQQNSILAFDIKI